MKNLMIASGCIVALAGGCAAKPDHTKEVADARSAIRGAEELGARSNPEAALYLQFAEEQLAAAQGDIEEGKHENAKRRLARAQVDAELAIELSHAVDLQDKAQRVLDDVREIKEDDSL